MATVMRFYLGSLVSLLAAAVVTIYALDLIQPEWGHAGSLLALAIAAAVASLIATLFFWLACVVRNRHPLGRTPAILGFVSSTVAVGLVCAGRILGADMRVASGLIVLALCSALAILLVRKPT